MVLGKNELRKKCDVVELWFAIKLQVRIFSAEATFKKLNGSVGSRIVAIIVLL